MAGEPILAENYICQTRPVLPLGVGCHMMWDIEGRVAAPYPFYRRADGNERGSEVPRSNSFPSHAMSPNKREARESRICASRL